MQQKFQQRYRAIAAQAETLSARGREADTEKRGEGERDDVQWSHLHSGEDRRAERSGGDERGTSVLDDPSEVCVLMETSEREFYQSLQRPFQAFKHPVMEASGDRDLRLCVPGPVTHAQGTSTSPAQSTDSHGLKRSHAGAFKKVCRIEEESVSPFPGLPAAVLEMKVKEGSKIRNLMGFAMTRMQDEARDGGQVGLRQVVFSGSGRAVTKTITCAEIMKRKIGGLHQMTKLQYRSLREVWESQEGGDSEMTVHRTLPSISILLSKDPLDPREPGYQPPENSLWDERNGGEASHVLEKRSVDSSGSQIEPQAKRPCL